MPYAHHSTPPESDTGTEPAAEELLSLARQVEAWREGRGLSRNQLCRQITGLNSKTHALLTGGELTGLVPENHLPKYRAALLEIGEFDIRQEAEPVLADLPPTRRIANAVASLKLNTGNDRFLLIEGESGAGKTTGLKYVESLNPDAIFVSADLGWCRPSYAVEQILNKTGYRGAIPSGLSARVDKLKSRLADKPRLILLDEGHHAGLPVMNLIKAIVNEKLGWVAMATLASIWKGIQAAKWHEIKQILHNRMHLRLPLPGPGSADVESFLTDRLKLQVPHEKCEEAERWERAFAAVASTARHHGLYAYCRKVAGAARIISLKAERPGRILPDDLFTAAASVASNTEGFDR